MRRAIILVIAIAGSARADEPASDNAKRAQDLYEEGKRHFDIGDYPPAIAAWKQSYLLSSAPLLLFNIGQAYRLSGNCAQANRFYLNYKRVEPKPKNQLELDRAMDKCKGVEPAEGDSSEPAQPKPVEPKPPEPKPTDAAPATPAPVAPVEPKPVPPRAEGRGFGGLQIAGIAVTISGALVLGYAGVRAIEARDDASTVSAKTFGTSWDTVRDTDAQGRRKAHDAGIYGIAGGLVTAAGATLWWFGHRSSSQVDVAITPHHAEVSWACAF